jgi:glycerol kinase
MIPALAGMGAPWWRPHARGLIHGFGLDTTPAHLIRALIDGVACQVAEVAGAVAADLGRPLTGLRADGGLTRSELLMQTQADLLQAPVEVYASPDATALGVGALAHLGATPGLEPSDAGEPWTPAATYEPQISQQQAAERLGHFRAVATTVTDSGRTR